MSADWLTEDDPWLVKAMDVTSVVNRGEAELIEAVGKAMDEYLRQAAQNLGLGNVTAAAGDVPDISTSWPSPQLWTDLVEQFVLPVINRIFGAAFDAAVEGVGAAVDFWRQAHIATVRDRLSPSRWPVMAFEKVRDLISIALEQGKGPEELAKELKQVLSIGGTVDGTNVWEFDARRIARTETIGAYNSGTYSGALAWQQTTGQTRFKQWIATRDNRTRETHALANRQIQPFTARFNVGDSALLYPGDPAGPADEVIQCRCAINILSAEEVPKSLIAASTQEEPMADQTQAVPDGPHWRGPLTALDLPSGDGRMLASQDQIRERDRKYLDYQPAAWGAHDGSVNIGNITRVWVQDGLLWGEGNLDFGDQWTWEFVRKQRGGFAGGVSIDLDDYSAEMACMLDGQMVSCDLNNPDVQPIEMVTDWRLSGATVVGIPAFPEAYIELIEENMPSENVMVAAAVGAAGLPLAARDRIWDESEARARVEAWAKDGGNQIDPAKFRQAFFYYTPDEPATNLTAYKLGFADIIDGELTAIPRGLFAVAGGHGVNSADIPESDKEAIRGKVSAYYSAMAKEFDDPSLQAPWDRSIAEEDAVVAAGVVPKMAPAEWFEKPDLDRPTPITVSSPNENGYQRVFGHIAAKDVCHTGIEAAKRKCVTVPESPSGYAMFNRTPYETDNGFVKVGRITTAHGAFSAACDCCPGSDDHACLRYTFNQALAHHDQMTVLAQVAVGEDEFGIWCAGVAASELDDNDRAVLSRERVSGDWRGNELIEVLALSNEEPGFPIPRSRVRDGASFALVAAGAVIPEGEVSRNEPEFDMGKAVQDLVQAEFAKTKRVEAARSAMRELRADMLVQEMEGVL